MIIFAFLPQFCDPDLESLILYIFVYRWIDRQTGRQKDRQID